MVLSIIMIRINFCRLHIYILVIQKGAQVPKQEDFLFSFFPSTKIILHLRLHILYMAKLSNYCSKGGSEFPIFLLFHVPDSFKSHHKHQIEDMLASHLIVNYIY